MKGKISIVLAMILCVMNANIAQCQYYSQTKPAAQMKDKMTQLHFFLHDIPSSQNPSVVQIAQANLTNKSNSIVPFGSLFAVNDAMRLGMEATSQLVGHAKGMYVAASQEDEMALVVYMDFGFTTGKFNGSSFVVFSKNPVLQTERELAVVGGTGQFRMARGFAKLHTRSFDLANGNAIVEYNVTLFHY
ncbi:dirigent protein 4 [Ricinus communis]|uniref:Dirigent protein n=1 Tax=Ricinus communis TaxID=3988 RepID=B9SBP7_RICCO|nr:dirigent protein 4 [Ricinus communis]EEF38995.1 conserved hypothetical protein [Ricinus communis]|eukprot:XP_002523416.1 dirigent protein 4 [Ricinus communis]